jgi:hypothetical protein
MDPLDVVDEGTIDRGSPADFSCELADRCAGSRRDLRLEAFREVWLRPAATVCPDFGAKYYIPKTR